MDEHPSTAESRSRPTAAPRAASATLKLPRNGVLLCLILVLGAALRIHNLSTLGFWIDEFCTLSETNGWGLHVSTLPPLGVLATEPPRYTHWSDRRAIAQVIEGLSREDVHPPLYFLLLRGWMDLLGGESESIVRSLNVVLSLVAIVLLYAAVRQQPGQPASVALWAALLMAVAGPQIEFAQEARNYVPLETLSLAATVVLLRIERLGVSAWRWAGLALATAAMLLTHYFAVAVIAAMGVYALWRLRGRARIAGVSALATGILTFAILWGPMLLRQRPIFSSGHEWLADTQPHHVARLLLLAGCVPMRLILEPGLSPLLNATTWLGLAIWALVLAGLRLPRVRLWSLWAAAAIGAVLLADLVNRTDQLKFTRFTFAAAPAVYVLVASVARFGKFGWLGPAGALLLAAAAAPAAYAPPWKLDFRTPAQVIADRMGPHDGLVFVGPPGDDIGLALTYNGIRHYLPAHDLSTVAVLQSRATAADRARLAACPQIWLVWLIPQSRTPPQVLPGFSSLEPPGQIPYFIVLYRGRIQ